MKIAVVRFLPGIVSRKVDGGCLQVTSARNVTEGVRVKESITSHPFGIATMIYDRLPSPRTFVHDGSVWL